MRTIATVTSKGQITVPKVVRVALGVGKGDVLEFIVKASHVEVRPSRASKRSAGALKKFLPPGWKAPTVEAMDAGLAREVARRAASR